MLYTGCSAVLKNAILDAMPSSGLGFGAINSEAMMRGGAGSRSGHHSAGSSMVISSYNGSPMVLCSRGGSPMAISVHMGSPTSVMCHAGGELSISPKLVRILFHVLVSTTQPINTTSRIPLQHLIRHHKCRRKFYSYWITVSLILCLRYFHCGLNLHLQLRPTSRKNIIV